jgi:ribosomal-protein-alanine N-acetyltransferase
MTDKNDFAPNIKWVSNLSREFSVGRLRRLKKSDLEQFQLYRNDPIVGRFQGWEPMSSDKALNFLNEMELCNPFQNDTWTQIGISNLETDSLIGDIGIYIAKDSLSAEIGFTLSPENQGKGIAYAAVQEAMKFLFESILIEKITAITDSRNIKSISLLNRLGFKFKFSEEVEFRGELCLEHNFEISKFQNKNL